MPLWLSGIAGHPRLCALALGAIAACGFAPLGLWPLTLLGMAGLMALIASAPGWQRAAMLGWLFGLGHFTIGNNWIAASFTYQAQMPGWLGWIAVVALSLYLAVYPAMAALAAWHARGNRLALVLAFAGAWIVSEWLRAWVFTGFAWNPLAMAALGPFDRPGLAAAAQWTGTYGLSGVLVLLAALWLAAWGRSAGQAVALISLPVLALLAVPAPQDKVPRTVSYTLVQPDIRQDVLNDPAYYEASFAKLAKLSAPLPQGGPRLVLWPESGVPDYLEDGYPAWLYEGITWQADPAMARGRIAAAVGRDNLLLTGAVDIDLVDEEPVTARNVVTALDGRGAIAGSYAKAHLVPYGEYLALRWLLEPLGAARLVPGALDFAPGPGPQTLDLGRFGKVGMQICYEIIFSGQVVDRANRPDFLFNPSNDGWFGLWGPPQHLAQARLRAIEEGLPVLRATTTGISAVINAHGVVDRFVPHHTAGRIDGAIPRARAPTLFAQHGNLVPLCIAAIMLVLSLVALRRRNG